MFSSVEDQEKARKFEAALQTANLNCKQRLCEWQARKTEYANLRDKLSTLPHKLQYDVNVNFGKHAFMPGKLVNSNQILVLLGENYFVERSAFQALEIVDRRLEFVQSRIGEIRTEQQLIESRLRALSSAETVTANAGEEETVEIKETYDKEEEERFFGKRNEKRKGVKFAETVKEVEISPRQSESQTSFPKKLIEEEHLESFDSLMKRLTELELEEEEEEELETQGDTGNESKLLKLYKEMKKDEVPAPIPIINEDSDFSSARKSILKKKEQEIFVNENALNEIKNRESAKKITSVTEDVFTGLITEKEANCPNSATAACSSATTTTSAASTAKPVSRFKQQKRLAKRVDS